MKKRMLCALLAAVLTLSLLAGCSAPGKADGKLSIVTTIFPEYDWVMQILGGQAADADVTMLLGNGADLHSYQPTAQDIITIASCDVFIYVGGASDKWVDDALQERVNPDMIVLNLMDVLGASVKEEEVVDGMQPEAEDEAEGPEYDEHIWLSLKNADVLVRAIAEAIAEADAAHADAYLANAGAYCEQLAALDQEYAEAVAAAAQRTILVPDRFPYRYLTDDYDLDYYAAFAGCSAETEASFETLVFLAEKLDELGLPAVIVTESSDQKLARTVIEQGKTKTADILVLDSMQSVTADDAKNGTTYLGMMEQNLGVLKQALA